MAGKRIPDLDPLSGAASTNDDKLVIYDSSTTTTKRIDRSQLAAGLVGDLPYTPSGGISATTIPTAIAELDSEAAKSVTLAASGGAALVGFLQAGDGAVARTVQDKLREIVNVKDFGAVGDGITDDLPAFQAAVDYLSSTDGKFRGGTVNYGTGRYLLNGTLQINNSGITLKGPTIPERSISNVQSSNTAGALIGGATTGPVIAVRAGGTMLEDVFITSTSDRQAAAINRLSLSSNCGISIETPDTSSAIGANVTLFNVQVRNQPAEGVYMAGQWVNMVLESLVCIQNGGHGLAIDNGTLVGRVNLARPGIINVFNYRAFDNGGHGYAIGNPSDSADIPYRVYVLNAEAFRNAEAAGQRYIDAGCFVRGENILVQVSAFGTTSSTGAGVAVSGRQINFQSCRYINVVDAVLLKDYAGIQTRLVTFSGGFFSTTSATPTFVNTDSGCAQVTIEDIAGTYTTLINKTTLNGIVIKQSQNAVDGFQYSLYDCDFNFNNSVTFKNMRTAATDPAFQVNDGESFKISGAASSTQINGMFRLTQNSGATGDASMLMSIGSNNWILGARRTGNTFSLRNSNGFSNAGNIINVLSDGGTNGNVGIGPDTTVPAHRLDVSGSINVRTGGAYRFNGTQVVGARQINADLGNTPNTGDANTDALITALKNVIIAHGLGAAS